MVKRVERVVFDWEKNYESKPQTEPPLPMTKVSRDHVPNPYSYDGLDHPLILKAREKRPSLAVSHARSYITELFQTRITMYDGAMGTMIQKHKLDEPDFRAERFKDYDMLIKGNNDLLSITQPHIIRDIYKKYLVEGGSQLIGTNTFSASASLDGGCDIFIIETIFDTLNAKAACFAVNEFLEHTGIDIPLFISGTLVDQSGRTLSGQTGEAFYVSIRHAKPMCVGLNCALGAKAMAPFLKRLSDCAECFVHVYSNAGLPNAMGGYDDTPADMAGENVVFAESGWVNMIGGCCGSTPPHIKAIWEACKDFKPRALPTLGPPRMWLSGLEDFKFDETTYNHTGLPFVNVGERCNIAGSRKFKRLIMEGKYPELMDIAKDQVEAGAHVVDINVDDGMLDGLAAMQKFVKMAVTEPDVAKAPFMIDSSKFDIVEAGLKWCQGKCIVNSISLKVGEELFVKHATLLRKHGAAVVVMAFDEYGQAATKEDKVRICKRSYDILVNEPVCFPPEDIIFDPNILTIGTGIEEHNAYGIDFITAIRESIHAVFLYHAARLSGMDMGIVNAAEMFAYEKVSDDLLEICEDANGEPMPDKPRRRPKKQPRYVFDWEKNYVAKPQTEPPLPMTKVSRDHVPNPYSYDGLDHPLILKAREKRPSLAVSQFDDLRTSWAQPKDTHPEGFPYFVRGRDSVRSYITELFQTRITMYDGAMGTMIQKHKLDEPDFRAERFKDYDMLIKGNNDLLSITQPHIIRDIYKKYLVEGGSQLIGTNTFSSTTIAQADYKMEDLVYELNYDSAREARDEVTAMDPTKPRFVCGAIGPTNRTASISPDVNDPTTRNCDFDELVEAYYEQCVGLADGGCDIFIIETIFDTLNAKAACFAVNEFLEHTGIDIPLFISGTLVDQSGRTLSGQTGEAFYVSIRHGSPCAWA
ncbi:methionine synthase [Aureococcus anophagefferens]|nr:methionine synthase [Aureococcus anophagefferens]